MNNKITVELWLHPLAWHVIKRDYTYDGRAAEVKGWLYNMVRQGLQRKMMVRASEIKRQRRGLVQGTVYISIYDFMHLGGHLRLSRQANISTAVYRIERDRLCHLAAMLTATQGISTDHALREILFASGIKEEEIAYETLKKHYQRKCSSLKGYYAQIINKIDIKPTFGAKKICVTNVPNSKNYEKRD